MIDVNGSATQSDMKNLAKDSGNMLNDATKVASEKTADLRARGMAAVDSTMAKAKEMQASAVESSKQLMRNTNDYVQRNPWQALSISAGVGVLLGILLKRR
jgi:ElaB/YqjD/DUF883 family membrane-anchored ribosome-binding protein